jgi:hypothetical protein
VTRTCSARESRPQYSQSRVRRIPGQSRWCRCPFRTGLAERCESETPIGADPCRQRPAGCQ